MTGTAMSANVEQLVETSPHAAWAGVRALLEYFCDVSDATIWERSGLWIAWGGGRAFLRGAETSDAPGHAAPAFASAAAAAVARWHHWSGSVQSLAVQEGQDMLLALYCTALMG